MKNKKAQAAVEYMILVGFGMALLIPLILLFYNQSSDTAVQINSQQLQTIGQKIVDNAESVYYLGSPSRLKFKITLPDNVKNITVTNKALIFTSSGSGDVVVPATVNITGAIPVTSGVHIITVESRGSYVEINST